MSSNDDRLTIYLQRTSAAEFDRLLADRVREAYPLAYIQMVNHTPTDGAIIDLVDTVIIRDDVSRHVADLRNRLGEN